MSSDEPLTDEQRFPLMTDAGRRLLQSLREHPNAPRFNFQTGDRLDREGLDRVREFECRLQATPCRWQWDELPSWLPPFVNACLTDVPFYRRRGESDAFGSMPTITRDDLSREPWAFVPDRQSLDNLIVYTTSGTTGQPARVLAHPEVPSMYLPLLREALARHGLTLAGGPGKITILLVCAQKATYTFPAISSFLDEGGFVKINLNAAEWRDPADRVRFIDDCNPEILSGDPLSFLELAALPVSIRPKALISSAMRLLPGYRDHLEIRFGCPVIDLYATNETGPIAVAVPRGHEILPNDLYVEILDPEGRPCPAGARGEVTVSGGRNPFLPLLRYRTGDWASMDFSGMIPVLVGLEGRPPTRFRTATAQAINNIDVTGALLHLALPQYALHQHADGSLVFRVRGNDLPVVAIRSALLAVFGEEQPLTIEEIANEEAWSGKIVQYTSDMA